MVFADGEKRLLGLLYRTSGRKNRHEVSSAQLARSVSVTKTIRGEKEKSVFVNMFLSSSSEITVNLTTSKRNTFSRQGRLYREMRTGNVVIRRRFGASSFLKGMHRSGLKEPTRADDFAGRCSQRKFVYSTPTVSAAPDRQQTN
jgi:hypothetical protein